MIITQVDFGSEQDLNKSDTVLGLAEYAIVARSAILEKADRGKGSSWEAKQQQWQIKPLLEEFSVAIAGDGAPMIEAQKLKRTVGKFKDLITGLGGFHVGMIQWKGIGRLFEGAFLGDLFGLWRTSEKQIAYVMDPSDPTQVNRETYPLVFAIYCEAARGYVAEAVNTSRNTVDNAPTTIEISPDQIFDFIKKKAETDPLVVVILLYLRGIHVQHLLYDSERRASIQMFLTALRFIGLNTCVTHCCGYVSLLSDWFRNWATSSPAMKKLYKKAILFRLTKNNCSIFTDRFMEWVMKDLRWFTGKHVSGGSRGNHLNHLRAVALSLNESLATKQLKTEGKDENQTKKKMTVINKIFCESSLFLRDSNVFGIGRRRIINCVPFASRAVIDLPEEVPRDSKIVLSFGGRELNSNSCYLNSISRQVDKDYWCTYHVHASNLDDPKRSEKDVKLKTINPTDNTCKDVYDREKQRCVSTSIDFLSTAGMYILTELSSEIDTLKKELNDSGNSMASNYARSIRKSKKGINTKTFRIETIVNARKKLISLNSNWRNDRLKKLHASLQVQKQNEMNALQAKIQKELELIGYDGTIAKGETANIKKSIQVNKCIEKNDNNDQDLPSSQTTNSTVDMMRCSQSISSGYTLKQ